MRSISTAGEYNNIRLSEVLPEGSQNPGCDFSLFKRTKTKNKTWHSHLVLNGPHAVPSVRQLLHWQIKLHVRANMV
jgi:hypothetical protein